MLTRFSLAMRSSEDLSSAEMLREILSTFSPGTGWRDLRGRDFIIASLRTAFKPPGGGNAAGGHPSENHISLRPGQAVQK